MVMSQLQSQVSFPHSPLEESFCLFLSPFFVSQREDWQGHGVPLFALFFRRSTSFPCLYSRGLAPLECRKLRLALLWDSSWKEWDVMSKARGIDGVQLEVRRWEDISDKACNKRKLMGPDNVIVWWKVYACVCVCVCVLGKGHENLSLEYRIHFRKWQKVESTCSGDRQLFSVPWKHG